VVERRSGTGKVTDVGGAVAIVVILLVFPALAAMGGVVAALALGTLLTKDGEARHEGSELLQMNK
jgi:hypothetical protein